MHFEIRKPLPKTLGIYVCWHFFAALIVGLVSVSRGVALNSIDMKPKFFQ